MLYWKSFNHTGYGKISLPQYEFPVCHAIFSQIALSSMQLPIHGVIYFYLIKWILISIGNRMDESAILQF